MQGVFLDIETNGLNPLKHHPLEIAFKILDLKSGVQLFSYEALLLQSRLNWEKGDPASLEVHGLTWQQISGGIPIAKVAGAITTAFARHEICKGKALFICQNPSFDRAFFSQIVDPDLQEALNWPYHWLDLASMHWAIDLQRGSSPWETGVSKDKIASRHHLPPEGKPHRASSGVDHLILCYEAVVGFPTSCVK